MPSEGLLNEARRRYPSFKFAHAELPELRGVGTFDNVLCETVIMHLDRKQIAASVRRLLDIVKPSGILYLSWRVTEGADQRDAAGTALCGVRCRVGAGGAEGNDGVAR